jgi:sn1-specific diacylglycerol lipase
VVEGDNFCGLNYTGLSIVTENLSNTELVYVSFKNDIVHKVYAVFLDHEKEQVVIAIRGTLSLEDCITDVICDPAPVSDIGQSLKL